MTEFYTLDGLTIDLSAIHVTRHGQPIPVTLLEYRLLTYLVRNAGRPVPVAELLREVWECDSCGTKAQVKNCVRRLRQKIEPDPDNPCYLLNQRRFGYYLPTPAAELIGDAWRKVSEPIPN